MIYQQIALRREIITSESPRSMTEEVLAELWQPKVTDINEAASDRDYMVMSIRDALTLAQVGATLDLADAARELKQ